MQREKTRTSALKPSDSQSLFKFRLEFHPATEEYARKGGKPWIWYSFDKPDERELFPPALDNRLREQWQLVLQRIFKYPDLYDFLKDCYPTHRIEHPNCETGDALTTIWMPNRVVNMAQLVGDKYGAVLEDVMTLVGLPNWKANHSNQRKVDFTPRMVTNRDFYGITAFERNPQVAYWFAARKLRLVTVYDNRCYHADNKMGIIDASQYPEPVGVLIPPPRLNKGQQVDGRSRDTVSVGSMLQHLTTPSMSPTQS